MFDFFFIISVYTCCYNVANTIISTLLGSLKDYLITYILFFDLTYIQDLLVNIFHFLMSSTNKMPWCFNEKRWRVFLVRGQVWPDAGALGWHLAAVWNLYLEYLVNHQIQKERRKGWGVWDGNSKGENNPGWCGAWITGSGKQDLILSSTSSRSFCTCWRQQHTECEVERTANNRIKKELESQGEADSEIINKLQHRDKRKGIVFNFMFTFW